MGLAIVHGIVENHDGRIVLDNHPGVGATIKVYFPVCKDMVNNQTTNQEAVVKGNERILFIDDEEPIVTMTTEMLQRLGYTVESQQNPIEALYVFKSKPDQFDLVITDMTMPDMNGLELLYKLKSIRSDIPIIICTGYSSIIDEKKAQDLDVSSLVMKPIVKSEIAKTIRNVLGK